MSLSFSTDFDAILARYKQFAPVIATAINNFATNDVQPRLIRAILQHLAEIIGDLGQIASLSIVDALPFALAASDSTQELLEGKLTALFPSTYSWNDRSIPIVDRDDGYFDTDARVDPLTVQFLKQSGKDNVPENPVHALLVMMSTGRKGDDLVKGVLANVTKVVINLDATDFEWNEDAIRETCKGMETFVTKALNAWAKDFPEQAALLDAAASAPESSDPLSEFVGPPEGFAIITSEKSDGELQPSATVETLPSLERSSGSFDPAPLGSPSQSGLVEKVIALLDQNAMYVRQIDGLVKTLEAATLKNMELAERLSAMEAQTIDPEKVRAMEAELAAIHSLFD